MDDNFVEIVGLKEHDINENDLMKELLGKMRLEEMISLNYTKSSNGGLIKKMMHAPTMTLYAVKEMPLETKHSRENLKTVIDSWISKFSDCPK